ncbi:hypothetical protein C0991_000574 [Blastosporella zonata]|nr:hypothetical protein C0991_000574 [Blastosporella zonata]
MGEIQTPEAPTQSPSLKRKRTQDDEDEDSLDVGYPHNLQLIYPPKKRTRTPSSENDSAEAEVLVEIIPISIPTETPEDPQVASSVPAVKCLKFTRFE